MNTVGKKQAVDFRVAAELGLSIKTVDVITTSFLKQVRAILVEHGQVVLPGLVTLRVRTAPARGIINVPSITIKVDKSDELLKALRARAKKGRWPMDKYGVDESESPELAKLASQGCPVCGAKVEKHGKVYMCPVHGSEPFEQPKKKEG